MIKKEKRLEKNLKNAAGIRGCRYIKIPDPRMITKRNRHRNREKKRPFDGMLYTPSKTWSVECKIDSNHLSQHQKNNMYLIDQVNDSFLILRKRFRKNTIAYQVERHKEGETIKEIEVNKINTGDGLIQLIDYIKELK